MTIPNAIFHLNLYKLVYICLLKVKLDKKILSIISLADGSLVAIVLALYILALELKLNKQLLLYNVKPNIKEVDLVGVTMA